MPTPGFLPPSPTAFGGRVGQNVQVGLNGPGCVTVFGHSYMDPYAGVASTLIPVAGVGAQYNIDQSLFRQTLAALGLQENKAISYARSTATSTCDNSTTNGNTRSGGWAQVLQSVNPLNIRAAAGYATRVPFTANSGLIIDCFGINDINLFHGKPYTKQYQTAFMHSARTRFSRYRAGAVFEESDASNVFSGGGLGGGTWASIASTTINSGSAYAQTSTVGATVTITVNASYDGGPIALGFIGRVGQTGADFSVTVDGVAHGTGTTNNITTAAVGSNDGTGLTCGVCYRITGLAKDQAHTIVVRADAIYGTLDYDYWQIEANEGNPVIVCNTAKLRSYSNSTVTDAAVDEWNACLYQVMSEFSEPMELANMDAAIGCIKGGANNYKISYDTIHLSELGARYGASAILDAYIRMAETSSLTQTTTNQRDTVGTGFYVPHAPTTANYYVYPMGLAAGTNTAIALNTLVCMPVVFTRPCTIRNFVVDQVVSGGTGSLRAGMYWDKGNGLAAAATQLGPYNLLADWGTYAWGGAGTTKVFAISGNQRILVPGLYWFVVANLAAAVTTTTLQGSHPAVNARSFTTVTIRPLSACGYTYTVLSGNPYSTELPVGINPLTQSQSSIEAIPFIALDIASVP